MTAKHEVATREGGAVQQADAMGAARVQIPVVDVYEDKDRIRLFVNMPGVALDSAKVAVENAVLTISGTSRLQAPDGYQLIGQEFGLRGFKREFTLSDQVQTDKIAARMKQGVLDVTLPKAEKSKKKEVQITT
ncbi:MAG: Hsp20/alpha crystallin family protein [Kiritimatiellae bacterium]|nr:Hsp20/alpha crystallin family protein [Kiritimatiellia bacterium]